MQEKESIPKITEETRKSVREQINREYTRGESKDDIFGSLMERLKDKNPEIGKFLEDMTGDFIENNPDYDQDYHGGYSEGMYDAMALLYYLLQSQIESNSLKRSLKY